MVRIHSNRKSLRRVRVYFECLGISFFDAGTKTRNCMSKPFGHMASLFMRWHVSHGCRTGRRRTSEKSDWM